MRTRARRFLKAIALGCVVMAVLLTTAVTVALSDWGLQKIGGYVVEVVNRDITGRLHVGRVSRQGKQLEIEGIVVEDAAGKTIARAARLTVKVAFWSLAHGNIHVEELRLVRPALDVRNDSDGLNLLRAFQQKRETRAKDEQAKSAGEGNAYARVIVERLEISDGRLQLVDEMGKGRMLAAPFELVASWRPHARGKHRLAVKTNVGASVAVLGGEVDFGAQTPGGKLEIKQLTLDPALVAALVPESRLRTVVNVTGQIGGRPGRAEFNLKVATGGGDVSIAGHGNLMGPTEVKLAVRSTEIDLSRILAGASSSRLKLDADIHAHATMLANLSAKIDLKMPRGHIAGQPVGPITLDVTAGEGKVHLRRLAAVLPGVRVSGRGTITGIPGADARADLALAIQAEDLAATASALRAAGAGNFNLAGHGSLKVDVRGPLVSPAADIVGRFGKLVVADRSVSNLHLDLSVPSLLKPWTTVGVMQATRAWAGTKLLRNVRVDVRWPSNDRFEVSMTSKGGVQSTLRASGFWRKPGQDLTLTDLQIRYPGSHWRSTKPVAVSLAPGIAVRDLDLRSGRQSISADLGGTAQGFDLNAQVQRLDLGKLGAALRPFLDGWGDTSGRASGTVSLNAHLVGKLEDNVMRPRGRVQVHVDDATLGGMPPADMDMDMDMDMDVQLGEKQAQLELALRQRNKSGRMMAVLQVDADAAIPNSGLFDKAAWSKMPLAVNAHVGPVLVQHLARPTSNVGNIRGMLEADLRMSGSLSAPDVELDAKVRKVIAPAGALGDAELKVAYQKSIAQVAVAIDAASGGHLEVDARTTEAVSIRKITAGDFSLVKIPIAVDLTSRALRLSAFNGLQRNLREVDGTLNGTFHYRGTLDSPDFRGALKIDKGRVAIREIGIFRDIAMDLRANERELRLDGLTFASGRGKGKVRMVARRKGDSGLDMQVEVDLDQFPIDAPQRELGEVSLRASAQGHADASGIVFDPLSISDATITAEGQTPKHVQSLDRPDDIVFVRDGKPTDAGERKRLAKLGPPTAPQDTGQPQIPAQRAVAAEVKAAVRAVKDRGILPIRLVVAAPRNIWVRAPDANVELGLSKDFQVMLTGRAEIFGTVTLRRGVITVLGRRFDVQDGSTVTFTGPPDSPRLDVVVEHENTFEQVRVMVALKGAPDSLELTFSSEPPLSEPEILTLMLTGRLNQSGETGEIDTQSQAVSIVGGFIASKLQESGLERLPIDVLSIGFEALEAGSYLTDKLYLGYVRRFAANPWRYENINAVHLEYQLSPSWSFEGEFGDAGTGSGDAVWERRY